MVGCGAQGEVQLAAIASVLPLTRVSVLDADPQRAKALAARLQGDDPERIDQAYRILYQRAPTTDEKKLGLEFLETTGAKGWIEYAQVLLTSNEFQFVD